MMRALAGQVFDFKVSLNLSVFTLTPFIGPRVYESKVKTIVTTILITAFSVTPGVAQEHDSQWRQLFNGHDLRNWDHVGDGSFSVENGILKTVGGMGLLWYTPEKLGRAMIRVEYKNPEGAYSSVFQKSQLNPGCPSIVGTKYK